MIEAQVIGEQETFVHMDAAVKRKLDAARLAVRKVGMRNEGIIKRDKLSGSVLHRRSGRLSAGVHTNFHDTETSFSAVTGIGPDLVYGKMHELGGTFTVKAHLRKITQAFGRPIKPVEVVVKEHNMRVPKRSFLLSTLTEQREASVATVRNDVRDA